MNLHENGICMWICKYSHISVVTVHKNRLWLENVIIRVPVSIYCKQNESTAVPFVLAENLKRWHFAHVTMQNPMHSIHWIVALKNNCNSNLVPHFPTHNKHLISAVPGDIPFRMSAIKFNIYGKSTNFREIEFQIVPPEKFSSRYILLLKINP